jgi:4-coumarate--CoA ligase
MPQKSRYQIHIPETDVLTWLFHQPPSCAPSEVSNDKSIYVSAVAPQKYSLSPSQVLLWIKRFALGLQLLEGFGDGDVVMVFSPNHVFVPVGYLGSIASGGIFCGCSSGFGVSGRLLWWCICYFGIAPIHIFSYLYEYSRFTVSFLLSIP